MDIIEDFSFFFSVNKKVRPLLRSGTPVDRICDHDMLMVRKQEMGLCVFAVSATNHRPLGTTISQLPPPPPRQQTHLCGRKRALGFTTRPFAVHQCFSQLQNVAVTGRTTHVLRGGPFGGIGIRSSTGCTSSRNPASRSLLQCSSGRRCVNVASRGGLKCSTPRLRSWISVRRPCLRCCTRFRWNAKYVAVCCF